MVIFHSFLYVYQRVTVFLLDTQKSQEIQRHLSTLDLRLLPPACRTLAVGEGDFVFSEVRKKIGVPNDQHHDVPISNVFLVVLRFCRFLLIFFLTNMYQHLPAIGLDC